MSVVKPTPFIPGMLVSTTAVEATPAWSAATTYAANQTARFERKIWRSIVGSNLNHPPNAADAATWWSLVGPDNV